MSVDHSSADETSAFLRIGSFSRSLLAMASGWELGSGPLALIARGPTERHVIGITAFGLALRNRGWRVVSLGSAARVDALAEVASVLFPEIVVLSLGKTRLSKDDKGALRALGKRMPVVIAGRAATAAMAATLEVGHLDGDPVSAAADLVANLGTGWISSPSVSVSSVRANDVSQARAASATRAEMSPEGPEQGADVVRGRREPGAGGEARRRDLARPSQ
jgi:hypothetical protein